MPSQHLTTKSVKAVQPGRRRIWINDTKQPGLQLLVHPSGSKSYVLYKRIDGSPRRIRLANAAEIAPSDARKLAQQALRDVALGVDPLDQKRQKRSERTVADLWEEWLENYAKGKKLSWREDESLYSRNVKPAFGRKKLSGVSRDDIARWHLSLGQQGGPYTANRSLALLRAMYNRAVRKLRWIGANPAIGIDRFRETARERFLQPEELARFFAALDREDDYVQDFFRLLLFTGARKTNVLQMRYSEIQGALWRPTRSKSGHPMVIPLVTEALQIIERRRLDADTDAVFPGFQQGVAFMVAPRLAWTRILKSANLSDLRIHDLRRTLGSWQASQGASLPIIGAMLGHRPGSPATSVYARLMLAPVRQAAENAVSAMLATVRQ